MTNYPKPHNTKFPPKFPGRHADTRRALDTARYLLDPSNDFARPYIRVPKGQVYVWPVGIEGFQIQTDSTLGIHKYIGDNNVDVQVVHRGEKHITLTGTLPGWTSNENMRALESVCVARSPERGKILHLPGLYTHLQYVQVVSWGFSHDEDDIMSMDIRYTLEVVKMSLGPKKPGSPTQPNQQGGGKPPPLGKHVFRVNHKHRTLRSIARKVYHRRDRWTDLYILNHKIFDRKKVPSHKIPTYRLDLGTKIHW